jgi:hypothetical protein
VGIVPERWDKGPTRWLFKTYSRAQVEELFRTCGLTSRQLRSLMSAPWQVSAEGVAVMPDRDLVLGLTMESRERIYSVLAAWPENEYQYQPYRYRAAQVSEWFQDAALRWSTKRLVKRLLYRRGASMAFSDPEVVLSMVPDPGEQTRLFKALARRSTLLVGLRVNAGADTRGLAKYWSVGQRSKDIYPLLSSLARQAGGARIGIVHLLPPIARELLYTYPLSAHEAERDCHWTSLNFLRSKPDDNLATSASAVSRTLAEEYDVVQGDRTMGDVLMLVGPDGTPVHSCVYVADNIVFTKNGRGRDVPWTLMQYDDVVSLFCAVSSVTTQAYRLKPPR